MGHLTADDGTPPKLSSYLNDRRRQVQADLEDLEKSLRNMSPASPLAVKLADAADAARAELEDLGGFESAAGRVTSAGNGPASFSSSPMPEPSAQPLPTEVDGLATDVYLNRGPRRHSPDESLADALRTSGMRAAKSPRAGGSSGLASFSSSLLGPGKGTKAASPTAGSAAGAGSSRSKSATATRMGPKMGASNSSDATSVGLRVLWQAVHEEGQFIDELRAAYAAMTEGATEAATMRDKLRAAVRDEVMQREALEANSAADRAKLFEAYDVTIPEMQSLMESLSEELSASSQATALVKTKLTESRATADDALKVLEQVSAERDSLKQVQ